VFPLLFDQMSISVKRKDLLSKGVAKAWSSWIIQTLRENI